MLAMPHLDANYRSLCTYFYPQSRPGLHPPVRRHGPKAIAAARKAAVEAPSAADELVSQATEQEIWKKGTASWLPWDTDALQEQRQALAQLQVDRPLQNALAAYLTANPYPSDMHHLQRGSLEDLLWCILKATLGHKRCSSSGLTAF